MRSLELFSGAGGLALGISKAGFQHLAVVEWDRHAFNTLAENRSRVREMKLWPIVMGDVRHFDFTAYPEGIELLAGGVPCQPFSIGGKHKGYADERNMFPEVIKAIRTLRPKAVLIENVRGLARPSFAKYFGYIELMLTYPDLVRSHGETWLRHLGRLEQYHTKGQVQDLCYRVVHRILNAADYGIPQRRERLFFVAIRSDLGIEWSFPQPTHSADSLLWQQYVTREYWKAHDARDREIPPLSEVLRNRLLGLESRLIPPALQPWKTVRDATASLGAPRASRSHEEFGLTHYSIPGARSYVGHTGSPLDEPAKTLKAGVHGVPGGENTLLKPDGSVRYLTIREAARLQTFPDEFTFTGCWTESMRQIGNAVPVELAQRLASDLRRTLSRER